MGNPWSNRPFPSSPGPPYQNEVKCSAFDKKMIFYSHANKTHYHKKGWALGLILKVRVFETQKWPIIDIIGFRVACMNESNETCFKLEELRRYIHFQDMTTFYISLNTCPCCTNALHYVLNLTHHIFINYKQQSQKVKV